MQDESVFLARVHARAAEIEQQSARRRMRVIQTVSAAAGLAVVIMTALTVPMVLPDAETNPVTMQASIFSGNRSLGYIVVGVLAFMLGVSVTILCFKLKQHFGEQEKPHDRDR
ncbi:MAG: hypothetical protein J5722_01285 [Oscillospiraceae bacterium]|nr:hypothetical protein [Oscillospiraceae bacterium]